MVEKNAVLEETLKELQKLSGPELQKLSGPARSLREAIVRQIPVSPKIQTGFPYHINRVDDERLWLSREVVATLKDIDSALLRIENKVS